MSDESSEGDTNANANGVTNSWESNPTALDEAAIHSTDNHNHHDNNGEHDEHSEQHHTEHADDERTDELHTDEDEVEDALHSGHSVRNGHNGQQDAHRTVQRGLRGDRREPLPDAAAAMGPECTAHSAHTDENDAHSDGEGP